MTSIETNRYEAPPHPADKLSPAGRFFFNQREILRQFVTSLKEVYFPGDIDKTKKWHLAYRNLYFEVINATSHDHALSVVDAALVDANFGAHPAFRKCALNIRDGILEGTQKVNGQVTAAAPESRMYFNQHRDQASDETLDSNSEALKA